MTELRRYSHVREEVGTPAVDALVSSVRRLVAHRAFRREAVTSPALKRHLPAASGYGVAFDEAGLRRRLEQAKLDGRTIQYLKVACDGEFDALREGAD